MDSTQILKALERERTLLEEFICLSEEQLLLLEDENIDAVDSLLEKRADLIMELTAIEATLGTWIAQIRTDRAITPRMVKEFRDVNDEIVCMANHIMEIDDQTHARLDMPHRKPKTARCRCFFCKTCECRSSPTAPFSKTLQTRIQAGEAIAALYAMSACSSQTSTRDRVASRNA